MFRRIVRGLVDASGRRPDGAWWLERAVRAHLAAVLAITCVTAWFSYAYFHIDEYFQVIELTRFKLGQIGEPLPWEHAQRLRPWLQPFLYWVVGRALGAVGVHDVFDLAFAFRLVTGLANVGALALFVRTTLPWVKGEEEQRLHLRVVTLFGFLPYLFVRTSSESGSMAALTAGFAVLLEGAAQREDGRRWTVPALDRPLRVLFAGALLGLAFEMRYQTAIAALGLVVWLGVIGRASVRSLSVFAIGGALALAACALVDRWGYGAWTFPAWSYFQANVIEGAAGLFGTDPPFAYLWLLPANVFFPVVLALLALAVLAWVRCPRHPVTWTTLPFVLVHNLLPHKEERFLFPIAILATAFVTMAIAPSSGRRLRVAELTWSARRGALGKLLSAWSLAVMGLLAFVPLGWHHHVRFARYVDDHLGDELYATVSPEIGLHFPAFRPRVYDIDKADPEELARRIASGTARPWLITDRPALRTGIAVLDEHVRLVYSELPVRDPQHIEQAMALVDVYNARVRPPLRPLTFRSLYRIEQGVAARGRRGDETSGPSPTPRAFDPSIPPLANDGEPGSCFRGQENACVAFGPKTASAGKRMCSGLKWLPGEASCPTADRLGTCTKPSGVEHLYAGLPNDYTPASAKTACEAAGGAFTR